MLITRFFLYLVGNGGIYSYGLNGMLCKHLCERVVRKKSCVAYPIECKAALPRPNFSYVWDFF